jgi:hypothetical protein
MSKLEPPIATESSRAGYTDHQLHDGEATLPREAQHTPPFLIAQQVFGDGVDQPDGTAPVAFAPVWLMVYEKPVIEPLPAAVRVKVVAVTAEQVKSKYLLDAVSAVQPVPPT